MRFRLRTLFLPPVVLALLCLTASDKDRRPVLGDVAEFEAIRLPLDRHDPQRVRLGALTYLGGAQLVSRDLAFSGFSALVVDGDRFAMLSDRGNLVRFRMGADWRPFDIRFLDLPAGPGIGARQGDRDSESLARDPVSGRFWVGFEGHNAIWRYDPDFTRGEAVTHPPEMRDWSENGGAESMARLPDGRFLVISETTRPDGPGHQAERRALLFPGDPTARGARPLALTYVPPPGYDPSDAAALPGGRLLVLTRKISLSQLFTAKLELVDIRGLHAGQVLRGRTIATFAPPVQHDNFEGLAVTREGGATILWIVSDDNAQWWQQTLLLKFRLDL